MGEEKLLTAKVAKKAAKCAKKIKPNSPWRNCLCFVTCDKACGNAKMIRGAD